MKRVENIYQLKECPMENVETWILITMKKGAVILENIVYYHNKKVR